MDQKISTTDLSKLAMTAMGLSMAGNSARAAGAVEGQFQKLLEQHAKPAQKPAENTNVGKQQSQDQPADSATDQTGAAEGRADTEKQIIGVKEKPQQEDPVEQAKRLAEMGAAFFLPEEDCVWIDCNLETKEIYGVYGPDEYIVAVTEDGHVNIPIAGLDDQQTEQLQKLVGNLQRLANAEDPEADAMLEATDPTVDHSPAKLLEKIVNEQTGKVVEQAAEEAVAPQEDEDIQVELLDVERAPEQVFQDVKAAPVKVGESFEAQQPQDVNEQIAAQVIPALEQGQTRVELQLTPEHLGTVKVEITQRENGALHIAITAQNSQTRDLLAKNTDSLQSLLASRGQTEVRVEVQRQEESQPQHNYDGHNSQHQQQQQEQQHRQHSYQNSQDFLHQLRLGLVDETQSED